MVPRLRALVFVPLVVVLLVSTFAMVAPAAQAAGLLDASVSSGIAGERVAFTGELKPKRSRPVVLQRKAGRTWVPVTSGRTTRTGRFSIATTIRPTSTRYRVYAKAATIQGRHYEAVATRSRLITTLAQVGAISLAEGATQGEPLEARAAFKPAKAGRPVLLQVKSGSSWTRVSSSTQTADGTVTLTVPTTASGTFTYRVLAGSYRGAAAVATGRATVTITAATDATPTDPGTNPMPSAEHCGPIASDEVWSADVVHILACDVSVAEGVALTIEPGAIVKVQQDRQLEVHGQLVANGTDGNPTVFTSIKDDSVGGDTNGDGSATRPGIGDWGSWGDSSSIYVDGAGPFELSWAEVRYGGLVQATSAVTAVSLSHVRLLDVGTDSSSGGRTSAYLWPGGRVAVSDSEFDGHLLVRTTNGGGPGQAIDITNNVVRGFMEVRQGGVGAPTTVTSNEVGLKRRPVGRTNATGISVSVIDDTGAPAPRVQDNTVLGGNVEAVFVAARHLLQDRLTGNETSGSPVPVMTLAGALNGEWSLPMAGAEVSFSPDFYGPGGYGGVEIAPDATLDLAPGYVLKVRGALVVRGELVASGTAAHPVVFTSDCDATVGVDHQCFFATFDGEWQGLRVEAGGVAALDGVQIRYAQVGLNVPSGKASIRGSFAHNYKNITACEWDSGACIVDATYNDWGSPAGPPASDNASELMVCGAVMEDPWIGQDAHSTPDMFRVPSCNGGSVPLPTRVQDAYAGYRIRIGPYEIDCNNGLADACQVIEQSAACLRETRELALGNMTFGGISPIVTDDDLQDKLSSEVVDAGSGYLKEFGGAGLSTIGTVTGFLGDLLGVVKTLVSLGDAYSACAPDN